MMDENENRTNQEQYYAASGVQVGPAPSAPAYVSGGSTVSTSASVQAKPQKKFPTWVIVLGIIAICIALVISGIASCTSSIFSSMGELGSMFEESDSSLGTLYGDYVAVIYMSDDIGYNGTSCSPEGLKKLLDEAESDSHVKAIVLRVNSGGGTSAAGEEMSRYVEECSLPIVVSSMATNASAAYEISAQTDYIFVDYSTMIGSIGTVITMTDISGLLEKLGIKMVNVTSADSKDSSYGTRALTEDEYASYQEMVTEINSYFIERVAQGRKMSIDAVKELATGMTFTGSQAVKNGLADEIGNFEDACDKAAELAGIDGSYKTIELSLSSTLDLFSLLSGESNDIADSSASETVSVH